jgi:hypothetical protein
MQENTIIAIVITIMFLVLFLNCASSFLPEATLNSPEEPPPTTAQQLEAGDASDDCSPTDVNLLACAQDEGGNTLALPPPAVTQDKFGYNSGRPHLQSSTLPPMYMDGSDE